MAALLREGKMCEGGLREQREVVLEIFFFFRKRRFIVCGAFLYSGIVFFQIMFAW